MKIKVLLLLLYITNMLDAQKKAILNKAIQDDMALLVGKDPNSTQYALIMKGIMDSYLQLGCNNFDQNACDTLNAHYQAARGYLLLI